MAGCWSSGCKETVGGGCAGGGRGCAYLRVLHKWVACDALPQLTGCVGYLVSSTLQRSLDTCTLHGLRGERHAHAHREPHPDEVASALLHADYAAVLHPRLTVSLPVQRCALLRRRPTHVCN